MANSLSKKISVFPISFDRSANSSYTNSYIVNTLADLSSLDESQKSFLDNHGSISALYHDNLLSTSEYSWIKDYYIPATENKLIQDCPNGRILSEKNISTLIRSLTDKEFFVVKADFNGDKTACNYVEFVIRGRYFALDLSDNTAISKTSNLWVRVSYVNEYNINDPNNDDEYEMLDAFDAKITPDEETEPPYNTLAGVDFYNIDPPADAYQLIELIDGKLRVPINSNFKLTGNSIENINGGTV